MINKVTLIGNVGTQPDVRTYNGSKVAKIRLATSERWKDNTGNQREQTEWHTVVVWGKLAEFVEQRINSGSRLYVEGSIHYSSYEKNGETRYTTEINATTIKLLNDSHQR